MGQSAFLLIQANARIPNPDSLLKDRLIWDGSKSGKYVTKQGYLILRQQERVAPIYTDSQMKAWILIWGLQSVIPKIKTFLWRGIHRGLATAWDMHRRIHAVNPMCQRCATENEFLVHLLFFCPASRATWFDSEFNLRADHLPLDFTEAILTVLERIDSQRVSLFCNILWNVWKARNEEIFQSIKTIPRVILKRASVMEIPNNRSEQVQGGLTSSVHHRTRIPAGTSLVLIDASWDKSKGGGWGAVMYDTSGNLQFGTAQPVPAADPFHAETMALLLTLEWLKRRGRGNEGETVIVGSDCKILVNLTNGNLVADVPSWRAEEAVAHCAILLTQMGEWVSIKFVGRAALSSPHKLANWARRNNRAMEGLQAIQSVGKIDLNHRVDEVFFQRN